MMKKRKQIAKGRTQRTDITVKRIWSSERRAEGIEERARKR
jgi:hypothetical protein